MRSHGGGVGDGGSWDHTSHPDFLAYYAQESQSEATSQRFRGVQSMMLRMAEREGLRAPFDVADIGCGAGTQSGIWAASGHRVYGLDVNEPLLQLARQRAEQQGLRIRFEVGSATALPWSDESMDVCLLPELLEHVADWRSCLEEAGRVLRPGGLLYVSTTNVLCPRQQEYTLPGYSWYPAPVKRYCERLAVTTRPELANYAKYPAVHWFSYYGLRRFLAQRGFVCHDRFALIDEAACGRAGRMLVHILQHVPLLRFLGHVATPATTVVAVKLGRRPSGRDEG